MCVGYTIIANLPVYLVVTAEKIRPDSWRKGMAVVKRELRHKGGGVACVSKPAHSSSSEGSRGDTAARKGDDSDLSEKGELLTQTHRTDTFFVA